MGKFLNKGLGKGLGALIEDISAIDGVQGDYFLCNIEDITPNPFQPRKFTKDESFKELVDSIREQGVLQPIVVREDKSGKAYQLIAGERRWRAAKEAGLKNIPVVIKNVTDKDALALALVENIQRLSLNPIEEAKAMHLLSQDFHLNQEEVARLLGKDRSTIANTMRLLKLPKDIQEDVAKKRLTPGHARCLLSLSSIDEQLAVRKAILQKGLSVRQTEAMIALIKKTPSEKKHKKEHTQSDAIIAKITQQLMHHFGTKVEIKMRGKRGCIHINYHNDDELQRILDLMGIQVNDL